LPHNLISGRPLVIVVGTDPASGRGGISNALPGYFRALKYANLTYQLVITHKQGAYTDKWRHWFIAFGQIPRLAQIARSNDSCPIAYLHVGGGLPSLLRKSLLAFYLRARGIPVLMQLHGLEVAQYLASFWWEAVFRLAMVPSNGIAILTPWWSRLLKSHGISKNLFVIPNPMSSDIEDQAYRVIKPVRHRNNIQILCMTRLEEGKGVGLVIDTLARLPAHYCLSIAGTGSAVHTLKKKVDEAGIGGRVTFHGWVSGTNKSALFEQSDIFFLPTQLDSFGMGFLEAMAWGIPVVALKWQAIEDVVENGVTGILVDKFDPTTLANAILSLDESKRYQYGVEGKKRALSLFSANRVGLELEKAVLHLVRKE